MSAPMSGVYIRTLRLHQVIPPVTGVMRAELTEAQTRRLFPHWAEAHPNFVKTGANVVVRYTP